VSDNGSYFGDDGEDWDDPAERVKMRRRPPVASIAISALLAAVVITSVIVVGSTKLLPGGWYLTFIAADAVFAGVAVVVLLLSSPGRNKLRFWLVTALSVVLAVANLGVAKVGYDYLSTVNHIQPPKSDTILYDIVVLTDGPTDISQLSQSIMGEVENDALSAVVHGQVLKRVQVSFQPTPTWTGMVDSLMNKDISSMVIQDGFMQVLSDANPDQYDSMRILASFEVDTSLAARPTPTPSPTPTAAPQNSYVLYISGIDTYGSIAARSRSDVNILMVVNPDTGKVLLVNTPRDFYVQLRGMAGLPDKLTHSGVYGVDVSVGTMEDLYGITISYYLRINFSSLVTIIDTLGGVDVDSAYDFSYGGYSFTVGMNHLNGAAALAFSRDRHDFAGGDRVRGQNQERVIEALIKKVSQPSVLMNYTQILNSIQASIQTSMSQDVISAQVRQQLDKGTQWDVTSISVDGTGALDYTYSYPGQRLYVMVPDQSTVDLAKSMIQSILNGS